MFYCGTHLFRVLLFVFHRDVYFVNGVVVTRVPVAAAVHVAFMGYIVQHYSVTVYRNYHIYLTMILFGRNMLLNEHESMD
jgi:hypothetical protein